jgi:hypothetical protein
MKTKTRTPQDALRRNVIDMALGFTATMRVFEKRSKATIASLLAEHLMAAQGATTRDAFEKVHESFCRQFVERVRVAQRKLKDGSIRPTAPASYGHAAKMFDVCAKVWFYYCHMPDPHTAEQVAPHLHTAIDTPILNRLKSLPGHGVKAESISGIDNRTYLELQALAARDRVTSYPAAKMMVHYDDLVWSELSRKDA